MIWILITLLPTLFEIWQDRNGETAKDKYKDGFYLIVVAIGIGGASHFFGQNMVSVLLLILAWRILIFDYTITVLLYSRGVIESPDAAKWWNYTGKTSKWDRLTGRVHWGIRMALRALIFAGAVVYYAIL